MAGLKAIQIHGWLQDVNANFAALAAAEATGALADVIAESGATAAALAALLAMSTAAGSHTATAGEASAGELEIDTSIAAADKVIVQITRAGAVSTSDAAIAIAAGVISVEDGSTYAVTEGDVINWVAWPLAAGS